MRWTSAISDSVRLPEAAQQVADQALRQLNGAPCHLAVIFMSSLYRTRRSDALAVIHARLRPGVLIGCSGSGIMGGDREFESVPALALVAASLPKVQLYPFAVSPDALDRMTSADWLQKLGVGPDAKPQVIALADPYTCNPAKLVADVNALFPGAPMIGGLVSGDREPGDHALFHDTDVLHAGVVGVALTGNVVMETVVSHGCRPIGRPLVITRSEEHIIWELGGRPALEALRKALTGLSPVDHELAQQSMLAGIVIDEMQSSFGPGDFLIRQLVGIDPPTGAMALSERVARGQTLQFHLRDPQASRDELRRLLAERTAQWRQAPPAGALLFNCLGRGRAFYGASNQELRTIRAVGGRLPVGGFLCNGEIGPLGSSNRLHRYTASLAVFRPAPAPVEPSAAVPARGRQSA